MKVVANFIPSRGVIVASFNLLFFPPLLLLSEVDAECGDVLYRAEVRWLSCGTVLKRALTLRLGAEMFINGKMENSVRDCEKWVRI
jgi:hypothetical protein